jgi:ATP dependent DNA ligase-like protein
MEFSPSAPPGLRSGQRTVAPCQRMMPAKSFTSSWNSANERCALHCSATLPRVSSVETPPPRKWREQVCWSKNNLQAASSTVHDDVNQWRCARVDEGAPALSLSDRADSADDISRALRDPRLLAGGGPSGRGQPGLSSSLIPDVADPRSLPPKFTRPQLSLLVKAPPAGPDWAHELKYDGYRIHARLVRDEAHLLTRTGLDWTDRYVATAKAVSALGVQSTYLDGELCAVRSDGITSFFRHNGRRRSPQKT